MVLPTTPTTVTGVGVGVSRHCAQQSLADRVLVRPQARRERAAHDRHLNRAGVVLRRERSAAKQRDAHRLEIAGRHAADMKQRRLLAIAIHREAR